MRIFWNNRAHSRTLALSHDSRSRFPRSSRGNEAHSHSAFGFLPSAFRWSLLTSAATHHGRADLRSASFHQSDFRGRAPRIPTTGIPHPARGVCTINLHSPRSLRPNSPSRIRSGLGADPRATSNVKSHASIHGNPASKIGSALSLCAIPAFKIGSAFPLHGNPTFKIKNGHFPWKTPTYNPQITPLTKNGSF